LHFSLKKILPNAFITALAAMVLLAYLLPFGENYGQNFPLKKVIHWGIAGIFFMYGLKLNFTEIMKDIRNIKLHALIQTSTFVIFPIIVLLFYPLVKSTEYYQLWLSIFFLAVLPSTVSSSVVMVAIAKGNISSAIFNASISGLIGLVMTPLWMSFFIQNVSVDGSGNMVVQLLTQVVLPVVLGILLNPLLGNFIRKNSGKLGNMDKLVILVIVYESFSNAFLDKIFENVSLEIITVLFAVTIGLFFLVFYITKSISKLLQFNREDAITAIFCGSKKSLVHGSVFAAIIIPDVSLQSIFLLPIMIYHAFQLFYASFLAEKWSKEI
jgi:solute carrier family 10 (sodium/bile acid cotransporter), member 7